MSSTLRIGGEDIGISGLGEIMERALEDLESSDAVAKRIILFELKARNYVPGSVEREYMGALWVEFRRLRAQRIEDVEQSYKGLPREKIPWYPCVDEAKCSGCSSCVEFCTQGVFTFDGKSHVTRPFSCLVGKSSCRSFCPEKAISFPTRTALRAALETLKGRHGITD